jgi:hypothetical protein
MFYYFGALHATLRIATSLMLDIGYPTIDTFKKLAKALDVNVDDRLGGDGIINIFMDHYKHTQVGYLMLVVTLAVLVFFAWAYITARAEPPSYYSGTNFAVTATMILILFILASFTTLTVSVDENYIRIKFGWGIFRKKFPLNEIASARQVKNHWYYGWGIRLWFWPIMWIFNVSGLDAIEIRMKDGKIYRIGTDEPEKFATAIKKVYIPD